MKIKFPIKKNILKLVVIFIISALVLPLILSFFVNLKTAPKKEEKLHVFITATIKEEKSDELIGKIFEGVSEKIVECKLFTFDIANNELGYSPYVDDSDILIFNKNVLGTEVAKFQELPEKYITQDTYLKKYGMKVFDKETKTGYLTDYIDYIDDDYFLFINRNSKHISSLNQSSVSDDAIKVIENIIK